MFFVALAIVGLAFGSFINALVWRTRQIELRAKSQELGAKDSELSASRNLSIFTGRSQCPRCGHKLAPKDLVPILSWLFLRGRCRYCGQPISVQYPLVEAATAAVFIISYSFWPGGVYGVGDWTLLITWLATSVGLVALFIFDFRWMMLPNHIIYPTLAVSAAGRLIYILSFEPQKAHAIASWALSVLVASGIFWLIFIVSSGRLIGYGDVRLGLIVGTVLAEPLKSILVIFLASLAGSLFMLPSLITRKSSLVSKIPYGPFLILATFFVVLFGGQLIDWYRRLLI